MRSKLPTSQSHSQATIQEAGPNEVERLLYLKKLESLRDLTGYVKIITGVRRCGKSTLLTQYIRRLIASGVSENCILYMNLESSKYFDIEDYKDLTKYLMENISPNKRTYVFIDEIQRVEGWEKSINALLVDTNSDIYITGSNSQLLSSELATFLTGRHISMDMLPLSFSEFCEMHKDSGKSKLELFNLFLKYGGFPGIDYSKGDNTLKLTIDGLYSSIVLKDMTSRGQVVNDGELLRLISYLMINIGNPLSINNIAEGMGKIHRNTVEKYLKLAESAYLFYKADRFDLKSTSIRPSPKYYIVDQGLRNISLPFGVSDMGRILENIVYLELIRRGYKVQIGKWDSTEVDFVVGKSMGIKEYIQVCYDINLEETRERKFAPLKNIKDSFPKTILVMQSDGSQATPEGICIKNIIDWLLEE